MHKGWIIVYKSIYSHVYAYKCVLSIEKHWHTERSRFKDLTSGTTRINDLRNTSAIPLLLEQPGIRQGQNCIGAAC